MNLFLKKENIHAGSLILVNREHALKENGLSVMCAPFSEQPEIRMEENAGTYLQKIFRYLSGNEEITGVSGYRTKKEQEEIFEESLKENGRIFTETYVAFPGCSEHQTGLAIDLAKKAENIDFICPEFPYEGICQEFREHAAEFGFIERYPKEKESVTGIGEEPWHFRYVGVPHAQIIKEQGMVLEEYAKWLKQFSEEKPFQWQNYRIYFVKGQAETCIEIPDETKYCISGNNVDGFVVTLAEETTGETNENQAGEGKSGKQKN